MPDPFRGRGSARVGSASERETTRPEYVGMPRERLETPNEKWTTPPVRQGFRADIHRCLQRFGEETVAPSSIWRNPGKARPIGDADGPGGLRPFVIVSHEFEQPFDTHAEGTRNTDLEIVMT
jgi:hypothetical protein